MSERIAIAGTGAIACELAVVAARLGDVHVLARSEKSATRARTIIARHCSKLREQSNGGKIHMTTDPVGLRGATILVEAVVEDAAAKADVLSTLAAVARANAMLATTTSSLFISDLAAASGRPDRFVGLHVFSPVAKMKLVELAFPDSANEETRRRAVRLCRDLGKEPVVVPNQAGFVVNRLLFPYLFSAVELLEQTGMLPEDVDRCMTLGAGHPMGPLALLDFVGLDVAETIGAEIECPPPSRIRVLVSEGSLGRKAGRGFYSYPQVAEGLDPGPTESTA